MTYARIQKATNWMPAERHKRSQHAGLVYTLVDEPLTVLAAFITLVFMASSCVVSFLVCFAIEPRGRKFSAVFLLHPLPNIGRTILELDAIGFGMPEKAHDVLIHEC
jgi:hypothetical protein